MKRAPQKKTVTDEHQRRASDPEASVWVSANAGSGKTHALTARVARLLLSGSEPQHILCLTFTKAAAAEMSARLYKRLGGWAMCPDDELRDIITDMEGKTPNDAQMVLARQLFARAIETPGGLKIQTIHAFCERLLGRFPLEAGVPAHFEILDDRAAEELRSDVRDDVLRDAAREPDSAIGRALAYIVGRIDESAFSDLLSEIAAKRAKLRDVLGEFEDADALGVALRQRLNLRDDESEEGIDQALRDIPSADMRKASAALATGTQTDTASSAAINALLADKTGNPDIWNAYQSVFLTKADTARARVITKKPADAYPGVEDVLRNEQERVLALLAKRRSLRVAESTQAVYEIARAILGRFEKIKRERAWLDYEDLIERSRHLLTQSDMAPWVLYKLDGGIDHILVDEAQDTSPDQWEIIQMLSEEFLSGQGARPGTRTIFAVGDEKQSIFSFQGADPAKFDQMKHFFEARVRDAALVWGDVPLLRSFRSAPQILAAVDAVFENEKAAAGLTAAQIPVLHEAFRQGQAGLVEIWAVDEPDEKQEEEPWDVPLDYVSEHDPSARLAARMAATIKGWLDRGEKIEATDKPITPGDVLILVRRRNAFVTQMVRQLKQAGIPVAGADRMQLTEQIAVMDLMALGQFVLLPQDDLTLASLLKSPLIGMDEEALLDLAKERKGVSLWQTLIARKNDQPVFAAAHAFLERQMQRADFEPPYEFFTHVLTAENGRHKLLARLGPDAGDPIDEFLTLALTFERQHAHSLQAFLQWLARGGAEIKRDMEQGRDEVRVMTVHGAKGLEAPIIFMPDTCTAPGGQTAPALLADAEPTGFLFWPVRTENDDAVTAAARAAYKTAQLEEYHRLLYVAMTRARDRLYVGGYRGSRPVSEESWYQLITQALVPRATPVKLADGHEAWRIESAQEVEVEPAKEKSVTVMPTLPDWVRQPAPAEPLPTRPLAPSRLPLKGQREQVVNSPQLSDDYARQRGTLIHRLLQTLPDIDRAKREEAVDRFLARKTYALETDQQAEIKGAVFAVMNDPAMAAVFAPGSRAEVPIVGRIDFAGAPILVSGQIDRLCVTTGHVLIIDYKTNRPGPTSLEGVSPAYISQMAAYRAVLSQIYPEHEIGCALLWTEGPRLMMLPAEMLDTALTENELDGKP
ncbi:MAG: double-strand break repair helicase AddA [Rhizobiales bacterium]|nr:double-strand break repair helicase AddA [Hyphomicrobiales bacterium]